MSGGVGRGRGWLNLKQNQNNTDTAVVGNLASSPRTNITKTNIGLKEETNFSDVSSDTVDLVNEIKTLNINDDVILINKKVKFFVKNWKNNCQTIEEVE